MITNRNNINLALAVWLLHDEYDYIKGVTKYISATTLMKPLRQMVLSKRVDPQTADIDVEDFISRAMGKSLHDSIEKSWKFGYEKSLKLMGYPEDVIKQVHVNPSDETVLTVKDIIPVYLEQRMFRELDGWTIGGKYDMVAEGIVQDNKSTSAYSWLLGGKDDDYKIQMSLYRWLDAGQALPKIYEDFGQINFIFTDWQKVQAKSNPAYPQRRVEQKDIPLMSLRETEDWVRYKLSLIDKYQDKLEKDIPECTDDELWRSEPAFKYYADPTKTVRSTKNFDTLAEANLFLATKGKGIVKTVPGEPKRCAYCEAFSICSQKDKYFSP